MTLAKTPTPAQKSALGYRYGMSQPSALLSLKLSRSGNLDLEQLDQRLEDAFCLPRLPMPAHHKFAGNNERLAAELAWRILQLGNSLLRAVRIPALDPGCILSVQPAGGSGHSFGVTLAIPIIEHMPSNLYHHVFNMAMRLVMNLVHDRFSLEQLKLQVEETDRKFVTRLYNQIPGGRSTIPLLAAAQRMRIPFRHLGGGVYLLGWGCNATLMDRSSIESDSAIGAKFSNHKQLSAALIRSAGLPAPRHFLVATEDDALAAAETLGMPVVVKPADKDRGEGVTVDIMDSKSLVTAFREAKQLSKSILVERQVKGVCHRLFVSHGKLLFGVKRRPKSVIGDGSHSVTELIEKANAEEKAKPPWLRLKPFPTDAMAVESLARVGLTLASIPEAGQYAPLRGIQSTQWGGVVEEVTHIIHPDNIDIATRATRLFGMASAGIDLISEDISQPWYSNGAIINEINFSPLLTDESVAGGYLPTFIAETVKGDGRIPIEVFVGGEAALERAKERQRELLEQGAPSYLTSDTLSLRPDGKQMVFSMRSLFERSTALLMNRSVAGLMIVVHTDELAHTGLPVDQIRQLTIVDRQISARDHDQSSQTPANSAVNSDALIRLLDRYTLSSEAF